MVSPKSRAPILGGPQSSLPFVVESFLSWSLCISCLSVSGYHYVIGTILTPRIVQVRKYVSSLLHVSNWKKILQQAHLSEQSEGNSNVPVDLLEYWLPLTITSRNEIDRVSVRQRHDQLKTLLQKLGVSFHDEKDLIRIIRSSEACRRLATLMMRPIQSTEMSQSKTNSKKDSSFLSNILLNSPELELPKKLRNIWSELLLLPIPLKRNENEFQFSISMIVPAFREKGTDLIIKLEKAMNNATAPERIQVVIVDAGQCIDLQQEISQLQNSQSVLKCRFGEIRYVEFEDGGGRGPCLNFGAKNATGECLTFCHSDTALPKAWDTKIISTLVRTASTSPSVVLSNSCAFSFGIDTSEEGLLAGCGTSTCYYYPPGIKAVETTANMRTHMYSLPYGDQVLSVPSSVFHYLGGFPDQCLMEDYELVGLLRKRAALLPKFLNKVSDSNYPKKEQLAIIGGDPALCSPRRWQKFGVLYVTFMNSKFVNLYAGGLSPDGLFQLYYSCPPPSRRHERSPWELALE